MNLRLAEPEYTDVLHLYLIDFITWDFFFWQVSKSSALQMNMTSIDIFIIIENNDSNNFKSEW